MTTAEKYNTARPYTRDFWREIQELVGAVTDGIPGPETASKIEIWQDEQGLDADGMAGPYTLDAMQLGPIRLFEGGFGWLGPLAIDADGAPNAYNASDSGIDYLANAGRPGNWWGIVTENEDPVVQNPRDPFPNFYVSTTALNYPGYVDTDPRRYVNAITVPYIALPRNINDLVPDAPAKGCTCFAWRGKTLVNAIYADVRKAFTVDTGSAFGEGSIALAEALGHDPWVKVSSLWRAAIGLSAYEIGYVVITGEANFDPERPWDLIK